jgi:uncharacterized protein DUF4202
MLNNPSRFNNAIQRIDQANAEDPHGKELLYSKRMSSWLERIDPQASEELRLAVRAQHIRRWTIPRSAYAMDRIGYLTWRTTLYRFHAQQIKEILTEAEYDDSFVERVGALVRKEQIKTNPEAQTLEDVICLVFLENYFADFAAAHDAEKVIGILRKTWKKMSDRGRQTAQTLEIPPTAAELVRRALSD